MNRKISTLAFIGYCFLGVAQCGDKDTLSRDVDLSNEPSIPIVINAALTLNAGSDTERTISAPWFLAGFQVDNNSTNTLYLVTLLFNITGFNNGTFTTGETSLDPGQTCEVDGFNRVYQAIIPANTRFRSVTDLCDSSSVNSVSYEQWFLEGLPESSDFVYDVEMTGEGFFVDTDNTAIERLILTGFFITE